MADPASSTLIEKAADRLGKQAQQPVSAASAPNEVPPPEPILEKTIQNMEPGEISPAIETPKGLHIVKVTEVDRTPPKTLDEVRESIRRLLYKREVEFRYREWLSSLRERSYVKIVDETGPQTQRR